MDKTNISKLEKSMKDMKDRNRSLNDRIKDTTTFVRELRKAINKELRIARRLRDAKEETKKLAA